MAEKTRVLLVEVFPKITQRISDLLSRIDLIELIPNNIINAEMALETIRQTQPDLIFLELELPGLNGIQCTQIIRKELPATQVVILSEVSSAETVRLAMRAGAVDYLNYSNLTFDELRSVIEHAHNSIQQEKQRMRMLNSNMSNRQVEEKKTPRRNGKVITVYSPKGGAGVSTAVANIGYILKTATRDRRVILVDLDLHYGDIALLYNQITNRSIVDLAIRVQNLDDDLVESVIFTDDNSGIDLLASPQKLDLSNEIGGQDLETIIEHLRHLYDYIIVNTSSYLNESSLRCFAISDQTVLFSNQQVTTVRSIRSFLLFLRENGIGKDKIMMVVNRFQEDSSITPKKMSEMLSLPVAQTLPYDSNTVEKAANLGIPFTLDNPRSEISRAYQKLTEGILNRIQEMDAVTTM